MAGWEMKIITAEARRLLALAAEDADLRAELRALAEEILAATEDPPDHPASPAPSPRRYRPNETHRPGKSRTDCRRRRARGPDTPAVAPGRSAAGGGTLEGTDARAVAARPPPSRYFQGRPPTVVTRRRPRPGSRPAAGEGGGGTLGGGAAAPHP